MELGGVEAGHRASSLLVCTAAELGGSGANRSRGGLPVLQAAFWCGWTDHSLAPTAGMWELAAQPGVRFFCPPSVPFSQPIPYTKSLSAFTTAGQDGHGMQSQDTSQTSSCCFFHLTWLHSQKLLGCKECKCWAAPDNLVTIDKRGNMLSFRRPLARRYIEYRRT